MGGGEFGVGGRGGGSGGSPLPTDVSPDPGLSAAHVGVDAGLPFAPADGHTPRDHPLQDPIAHQRTPGVALWGEKKGGRGGIWG